MSKHNKHTDAMLQFGLCCLFNEEPIGFKTYSFAHLQKLESQKGREAVRKKILSVWEHNRSSLQQAFDYCQRQLILGYRISSEFYPQVPRLLASGFIDEKDLSSAYKALGILDSGSLILSMHPGQHVNLGSPTTSVVENSLEDLKSHFNLAKHLNCKEVNIHIGGAYGNKTDAIKRFITVVSSMAPEDRTLLTLENDELNFSLDDVVSAARELSLRVVYDIHHQRCYELKYDATGTEQEYFQRAKETWSTGTMQRLHLSSPRDGFISQAKARPHADFIRLEDIPAWLWQEEVLVDIEAKSKEVAIRRLQTEQKSGNV